jgi:predicted glycosyltransferase
MTGKKILFHTVNGNGLGHLVRTVAIANAVRRREPDSQIVILTSCEETGIAWRQGHTCIKVPSHEGIRVSGYPRPHMLRALFAMTQAVFENLRPDVLFADAFPIGVHRELEPMFNQPSLHKILNFQYYGGIFTAPYLAAMTRYDRIVVAYPPVFLDALPVKLGDDVEIGPPVVFGDADGHFDRAQARHVLGLPADGPLVLATCGGGGNPDTSRLRERIITLARSLPDIVFALPRGPLSIESRGDDLPPNVLSFVYFPLSECLGAFDAAVATTGHNTVYEHLRAGIPTVWCPLGIPSKDQVNNATKLADNGLGQMAELPDWSGIEDALMNLLEPDVARAMAAKMRDQGPFDGADNIARIILGA